MYNIISTECSATVNRVHPNAVDDLALGKPVLELCNHPQYLTDEIDEYGGNDRERPGYLGTHWPTFVTVDLLREENVGAICFKLWDWEDSFNKDPNKSANKDMRYAYRILVSVDRISWIVLFDCADARDVDDKFRKGWQCFSFSPRPIRYVRIHCLRNCKNTGFHIVKLKVFRDSSVGFFNKLIETNPCILCDGHEAMEVGDGAPLSFRLFNFAGQMQEIQSLCSRRVQFLGKRKVPNGVESELNFFSNVLHDITHQRQDGGDVVGRLFKRGHEVEVVAGGIDETRNLIAEPVRRESENTCKDERIGFLVDFFFGMFQFAVVAFMYFIDGKKLGWLICCAAFILSIVIFLIQYFSKPRRMATIKGTGDRHKPLIASMHDSMGNKWIRDQNVIDPPIDSRKMVGLCCLSLPAFGEIDCSVASHIYYNEQYGFYSVPTPGWVEFDFGRQYNIRYIRFLLWDNAGSGKRQRSHRAYNYRILFRAENTDVWRVLHDTMGRGSCGWQEFVNASEKPWNIRFVRLYGVSNSGATGAGCLQIVRIGISQEIADQDLQHSIRNRIVKYGDVSEADETTCLDTMKIIDWMRRREFIDTSIMDEANISMEWKRSIKGLLSSCGRSLIEGKLFNESALALWKGVSVFAEQLISEKYSVNSSEDFARDIQSLVSETLKPVLKVNAMKKRFDSCMRLPRIILVLAATGPLAWDCVEKNSVSSLVMAFATCIIALFLIFKIWNSGTIKAHSAVGG